MKKRYNLSVHEFINFSTKEGDLFSSFVFFNRAKEGIKAHQLVQKSRPDNYRKEVIITQEFDFNNFIIVIDGRIDGVFESENFIIIDEIKSTYKELNEITFETFPQHFNQLITYAFIYTTKNMLNEIIVQLTYYQLEKKEKKELQKQYSYEELSILFANLLKPCVEWYTKYVNYLEQRNYLISNLEFPYSNYRKGQREMAVKVYKTIKNNELSFFQAPTGIGKTIATIFPAIKSMKYDNTDKIFYLTAKSLGKTVAEETLSLLLKKIKLKVVTLTAKEKICFMDESDCDPEKCIYAKDYFEKLKDVMNLFFQYNFFNANFIKKIGLEYKICPFEFSLDLALWSDIIICDYNYIFDPRIKLKRFFDLVNENYVFLIDESHNLPDRAIKIFSAGLSKKDILKTKKIIKKDLSEIAKILNLINSLFVEKRKLFNHNILLYNCLDEELIRYLRDFLKVCEKWMAKNINVEYKKELVEIFFKIKNFVKISEFFDEKYKFFFHKEKKDIRAELYCLDPSKLIMESLNNAKSVIFFSASLLPEKYYKRLLTGKLKTEFYKFPSPFPKENLKVTIEKVSTRYVERNKTLSTLIDVIDNFLTKNYGNTLVFFPSYEYLNLFLESATEFTTKFNINIQNINMTDEERKNFLNKFYEQENLKAFGVLGGIFGEGINLVGENLKFVVIVGIGLPKINVYRNFVREYFDNEKCGFNFAYLYPAFNKVLQAVGRVIRSESDKGKVLLIDDRFYNPIYYNMLPFKIDN